MATFQMNFLSFSLGMQTNFSVFFPSYEPSKDSAEKTIGQIYPRGRKYPVLWLLHSDAGDDSEYLKYTNILRYAQKRGVAVVMPCGYNMMYSDDPTGQKFLKLVTWELPILCRSYFPFSDRREDNFIGGVSLGAYGALKAALNEPEQYAKAILIDGGFGENMTDGFLRKLRDLAREQGLVPPSKLDDAPQEEMELYAAAKKNAEEGVPLPKILMAWGENSETAAYSKDGADALSKLGYDVTKTEYAGQGRGWDLWDAALKDSLERWL